MRPPTRQRGKREGLPGCSRTLVPVPMPSTPAAPAILALADSPVRPSTLMTVSAAATWPFSGLAHIGPDTPCLRFHAAVALAWQDSVPAWWLAVRRLGFPPTGFARRVSERYGPLPRPLATALPGRFHRPSLDLGWALLSGLMGDPLRYGLSSRQAAALLRAGHRVECWTPYPGYPPLRLFTGTELTGLLHAAGLAARRAWGLHTVTSLLPSTVLHRPRLSRTLAMVYGLLRRLDRRLSGSAVSRALGNSLVVLAVRTAPLTTRSSEAFAAAGRVLG